MIPLLTPGHWSGEESSGSEAGVKAAGESSLRQQNCLPSLHISYRALHSLQGFQIPNTDPMRSEMLLKKKIPDASPITS